VRTGYTKLLTEGKKVHELSHAQDRKESFSEQIEKNWGPSGEEKEEERKKTG